MVVVSNSFIVYDDLVILWMHQYISRHVKYRNKKFYLSVDSHVGVEENVCCGVDVDLG